MSEEPRTYEFTMILDAEEITDEMAGRLFEAGCDDATLCQSGGEVRMRFSREAGSFVGAIRSAMRDVSKAGYHVTGMQDEDGRDLI